VNTSRLEMVVRHDGRLDLMCCLLDSGPLSVPQLAARIGGVPQAVRYWVNLLDSFDLVEKRGELDDGEGLYAITLDEHPEWVREAVWRHRMPEEGLEPPTRGL
jgi:hypothetical protein